MYHLYIKTYGVVPIKVPSWHKIDDLKKMLKTFPQYVSNSRPLVNKA